MYTHQDYEAFYLGHDYEEGYARRQEELKMMTASRLAKSALLILEDFDAIRAFLSNHFKTHGYDVFSAATLKDAIALALDEEPKIVIIDYDLNRQNAYRAIEDLRRALPESQIVLMGGPGTSEVKEKALLAGATRVLAKAYHLTELDGIVDTASDMMNGVQTANIATPTVNGIAITPA